MQSVKVLITQGLCHGLFNGSGIKFGRDDDDDDDDRFYIALFSALEQIHCARV